MRAVVIDDSAFDLEVLAHQLTAMGFDDVRRMRDAGQALALLAEGGERFDVVLCDLQMPGVDGVQVLRALAEASCGSDVVLVSGEEPSVLKAAERLARARGLRVLGSLSKPVEPEDLRALLARKIVGAAAAPQSDRVTYGPDEVRRAIARGRIRCHCQPKVDLSTGALVGVEMLARWHHPEHGLVYPDRFVPVAEDHGFVGDLTRAVLHDALDEVHRWRAAGMRHTVAVNLSMDDLTDAGLPDVVQDALDAASVPAAALTLEVTERRLLHDVRTALDILTRLRLRRIELSIDDFGTGHSSLAQLRDLPFTELKIDRGFILGVAEDPNRAAIVSASLDLARSLSLRSVAEGVEDAADWHYLRAHGCDVAQGYFIARPMPPQDLAAWLAAWEDRRHALTRSPPSPH